MTLIDYAKYLLNVCGRRFTHLYRRHYLDSTPALPSLSALLSYLKTQTATIYGYLQTRFAGDPTSGIPSITPTQPLTFANLLPNLQKLATRKIDAGASTQIPEGISLVRLMCDTTTASAVTELIDTNTGWTIGNKLNTIFNIFTSLSKITVQISSVSYITNSNISNLTELKCPNLEETNVHFLVGNNNSLTTLYLPKLRIVNGGLLFDGNTWNYTATGYSSLTELHLPMLHQVVGGNKDVGAGYFIRSLGLRRLFLDSLELLQINNLNYQANFITPNLEYMYIGYTENSRTNSIILGNNNDNLSSLTDIELKDGFKRPLNVSGVTTLTRENIVNHIINKLAINDGTVITITLGSTNLAKLTAEDIAIANAKGYTLA